jgi:phosphoglycerol transferase
MTLPSSLLEKCKNVGGYLAAALLSTALMVVGFQLWRGDLKVPILYEADSLLNLMLMKGVMENGWYLTNGRLGMPLPQTMHDFPLADGLHFGFLKLLAYLFHDAAASLNAYIFLSFPFTALSTYWVLRRSGLARLVSVVASVLYAGAPYHFGRSLGHPFLACYYVLPLMMLVVVRLCMGRLPFVAVDPETGKWHWSISRVETAGAVLVCLLTSASGVYYAFFSCFTLVMAGIKSAIRDRQWAPVLSAGLLVGVVSAGVGVSLAPSVLYSRIHGRNFAVGGRYAWEADIFGLNVAEMLLPLPEHRFRPLARIHILYRSGRTMTGENVYVPLGLLASAGFVWLLARFTWRRTGREQRVEDVLAYLTVSAVMLGTVGGAGALFNFYVTPMIRCYDRLSILIAFFALFALALLVQRRLVRYVQSRRGFVAYSLGAVAVLVLGAADQTVPGFVPDYDRYEKEYECDADFGARMEAALPVGTMVYQLPQVTFPECPAKEAMRDYDQFRPYLHTRTLRFSYGAMRGREASRLQAEIAKQPLPGAVKAMAFAGFGAIHVDRAGYADHGANVERVLSRLLGVEPIVSSNERHACFDMRRYVRELHRWHADDDWESQRDAVLHPLQLVWRYFSCPQMGDKPGSFTWCGKNGEVEITNEQARARQVVLKLACSAWPGPPGRLVVEGESIHEELMLAKDPVPVEWKVKVGPGKHVLHFSWEGPIHRPAGETRNLGFRVWNAEWRVEE